MRIGYHPRADLRGLGRQYFAHGAGRARTVRRHPGSMQARQFAVPAHFAVSLLAPWWPWALLWPAAYLLALVAVSARLMMRHRSACALPAGAAAAVMHTAWAVGFCWSLAAVQTDNLLGFSVAPWRAAQRRGIPVVPTLHDY